MLALAAELAGEGPVGSHHILEAMLQQPDSAAAKVLGDAGIDLDQLAAKLDQVSIEDTADDTPQQAAARQLELSVTDETVTVVLRDPASLELGKRIVQLNGGRWRPAAPSSTCSVGCGRRSTMARRHRACAGTPAGCSAGGSEKLFTRGLPSRFRRRRAS